MWSGKIDATWSVKNVPYVTSFDLSNDGMVYAISSHSASIAEFNRSTTHVVSHFQADELGRPQDIYARSSVLYVCTGDRVLAYERSGKELLVNPDAARTPQVLHRGMQCNAMLFHSDWTEGNAPVITNSYSRSTRV